MQHKVENLLTGEVIPYDNKSLIELTQNLYVLDKGEFDGMPTTLIEAFDYLNTYCDNLLLL